MKTNRVVIVQCRLSSTRLPGKALMDLGGKPVISWCLESMHKVKADRYFVATDEASYELLKPVCEKYNFEIFAGSLDDVLGRFCALIRTLDAKTVVRATGDNPFLFYEAVEESLVEFENRNKGKVVCDYLTFTGLPHGSGVEIMNADSLLRAESLTDLPYDHEHVGPALYNHKDVFKCDFVKAPHRFRFPELRTTIDTYSDYLRALQIVNYIGNTSEPYTTEEIIEACNSKAVKMPVVLVPSVQKGQGTGHLHRCLSAAVNTNFFVYIPENKTLEETDSVIEYYIQCGLQKFQLIKELPDCTYSPIIITDSFKLTESQLENVKENRGLISIDEGSDFSDYCDYLVDIIPSLKLKRIANICDTSYITKPENKRDGIDFNHISKVLICLGGEDPAGFTIPAINALKQAYPEAEITAIISESAKNNFTTKDFNDPLIKIVSAIPKLREHLYEFDLVITHYGLTAFEAVYAGCGVILLPTTKLHRELAEKYDFAYVKSEKITTESILSAMSSENLLRKKSLADENKKLSDLISSVSEGTKILCPICGKATYSPDAVVARNEYKTYRRCQTCGMVYMSWSLSGEKVYKKSYFFDEYKKQYGKTYQEDFESIKATGKKRLSVINSLSLSLKDKNLLDIGCAYGPFLSAANDLKINPFGTDISPDAVDFVQNELHFPAVCSAFPKLDTGIEFGVPQFDIVTMWYVIEHFKNLDEVLRKVYLLLKKGGIFAFSTPSGEGISAKSNKANFFRISPDDHYTIWEPSNANKILKKYGFEVLKVVSTGHHPERFPMLKDSEADSKSLSWNVVNTVSKVCKLGDTCEIYCKKR